MSGTPYSDDEIAEILCRADRMIGERHSINHVCQSLGISRSSFYRWQRRFGLRAPVEEMVRVKQRVKSLEDEIARRETEVEALRIAAEGN